MQKQRNVAKCMLSLHTQTQRNGHYVLLQIDNLLLTDWIHIINDNPEMLGYKIKKIIFNAANFQDVFRMSSFNVLLRKSQNFH